MLIQRLTDTEMMIWKLPADTEELLIWWLLLIVWRLLIGPADGVC